MNDKMDRYMNGILVVIMGLLTLLIAAGVVMCWKEVLK